MGSIYKHGGWILYVQQKRGDGRTMAMGGVRLPRRQLPDVAVSRASGQAEPAGVLECSWSGGGSMYINQSMEGRRCGRSSSVWSVGESSSVR